MTNEDCVAFSIKVSGSDVGECCLFSNFAAENFFALPSVEFYSMSQCTICIAGYYKDGRKCRRLSQLPSVSGDTAERVILIPLNAEVGTVLSNFQGAAEAGHGPATHSLIAGIDGVPLTLNEETGALSLSSALSSPGSFKVRVRVTDAGRDQCAFLDSAGQLVVRPGNCFVEVPVTVQTAVFLSCPSNINLYLPLSASTAELTWREPSLPSFLSTLAVSRNLGGDVISAGPEDNGPYEYPVGSRTVTYMSEPLTVGGSLTCQFEIKAQFGFSIAVPTIGRKVGKFTILEYVLVDLAESNDGARLPSFSGVIAGRELSIGLVAPDGRPFTMSPKVGRGESCTTGLSFALSRPLSYPPPVHT